MRHVFCAPLDEPLVDEEGPILVSTSSAGTDVDPLDPVMHRTRAVWLAPSIANPRRGSRVAIRTRSLYAVPWVARPSDPLHGAHSVPVGVSLVARGVASVDLLDVARLTTSYAEGPLRRPHHPLGVDVWWWTRSDDGRVGIWTVPHATVAPSREGWLRIDAGAVCTAELSACYGGLTGGGYIAPSPGYLLGVHIVTLPEARRAMRLLRTAWAAGHVAYPPMTEPF